MIPKKLHYIWLGDNDKDRVSKICINGWNRIHPDYEIIEWNEKNLPIDELIKKNKFFKECYEKKMWAFMSDYLRLYILYNEGGIYLDTDVELLKRLDDFLIYPMFLGKEYDNHIGTGLIGAEKGNKIIKNILNFYDEEIWNTDAITNPIIFNIVLNRCDDKDYKLFSRDYFSPYTPGERTMLYQNENTHAIHWFNANWGLGRKGYVFFGTKHYRGLKKIIQISKKNVGYYLRKYKLK